WKWAPAARVWLSCSSVSDLQVWVGLFRVWVLGLLGRAAGEGEEHVIERGLVDLDVIDGDPRLVEGAHDGARQAAGAAHGRAQATPVVADVHPTRDERFERNGGGGVRLAQRELEARPADLCLQLSGGAAGYHLSVVDHNDLVGELVRLVQV